MLIICIILSIMISSLSKNNFLNLAKGSLGLVDNAMTIFIDDAKQNTIYLCENPLLKNVDASITSYKNATTDSRVDPLVVGGNEAEIFKLFKRMFNTHPNYVEVFFGTEFGGFVSSGETTMPGGYNPVARPWYKLGVSNPDKPSVTDAYLSTTGEVVISITNTIKNNGKIVGCAGIDVSLGVLTDLIDKIKLGKTGFVMLVQGDGTILANPKDKEMNNKKLEEIKNKGFDKLNELKEGTVSIKLGKTSYTAVIYTSPTLG